MLRVLLIIAIVFALPFIGYTLWRAFKGSKPGEGDQPAPVLALTIAGALLAAVTLVTLAWFAAEGDEGEYQPRSPAMAGSLIS